jgi:hypothetical protein
MAGEMLPTDAFKLLDEWVGLPQKEAWAWVGLPQKEA